MFTKNTEKLESFIGTSTQFKGEARTKGTLRIDGSFEGTIEADWLVLGDKSYLKGNAQARGIIVGGIVEGNLAAKEIIEIKQKGQINGDIVTGKLTVAEGGVLNGRATMHRMDARKDDIKLIDNSKETAKA